MARRLPPFAALRAFEAVARTLSFTRAARDLGVTQAAVSRQVRALESRLGVVLVARGGAENALTDAGRRLFHGLRGAFDEMDAAVRAVSASPERAVLTVSVAPFFSSVWLTPRIMGFIEAHPAIDLRLHHAYTPPDYRREQVDLGVNWGAGDWPGVTAEKVLDGGLTPVCAPRLAARLRDENRTDAVLSLPLFYEFREGDWRAWLRGCGGEGARVDGASMTRIDDSHALRRVALEGHGLALFFRELAAEDLAIGRLVQPFDHVVDTGSHYFLTCPEGRELSAAAKAFRRWLFAERRADG